MYTIKIWNPYCSEWFDVAKVCFYPDQQVCEIIANEYCVYTYSNYDKIRVYRSNKVMKEYIYE